MDEPYGMQIFQGNGCIAALLTFTTESTMASSLLLLSPAQLAGSWTFYPQDDATHRCTVQLVAEHKTFNSEVKCLKTWLGEVPKKLVANPDGIYLMGPDGTALVHMNRIEPGAL